MVRDLWPTMCHRLSRLGGRLMVLVVTSPSLHGSRKRTVPHRAQNILLIRRMAAMQAASADRHTGRSSKALCAASTSRLSSKS